MAAVEEKRTRLSPQARRRQLVTLGVEMLSGRSIDTVSVEELAEKAGVSRGLIFHYFGSKQGYLLAVVRHLSEEMIAFTDPDPSLPPLEQLSASLAAYLDYVTENRDGYVSLLRGSTSNDPEMRAVFEYTRGVLTQRVLERVPQIGVEVTPRVELAARGWVAFVEETVISWLREPGVSREELLGLLNWALPAVAMRPEQALALLAASEV
ncbi:TetR/AcrR family transcriptional regulator [Tomitella gaofuii]|uniref:TetR/AcrR family transcriptional regulator n=1 Tax=Tomitella gaofuii TaxID=2760083 RepID=UPI0015FA6F19|nr:TetR/AcrR family transcriptional regulator [Tomitella gaofuii]